MRQEHLWDELEAKYHWFHILRAAVHDNKIAEMGTTTWAIYCIIKAYTQLDTGIAWPSHLKIAEHAGVSDDTVARSIDKLLEMGLLRRERVGRHNTYQLIESVPLERLEDQSRVGQAEQGYIPRDFKTFIGQLKEYAKSGDLPAGCTFNIVFNLTNITQGAHSTVNSNQVGVSSELHQFPERVKGLKKVA